MTRKVTRPPVCHMLTTSGGCDYCSSDETLGRGEEVAQALVVPCSGLCAHSPARSHRGTPWAQPRPHRVGEGHGGHRHTWKPCHMKVRGRDTRGHTHSRKAGDCGCARGPPGCTKGCAPGKETTGAHRRTPESHGTTTLDTQLPS